MISARLGKIGLGAGEMATLDLTGDGFLSVAIPSSELGHLTNANGALVSNKGKILADGGTVFLSAATASNILRNAINSGGLIRANSVGMHNGKIVLNGGGGSVNVTGHLIASGGKHHNGGKVEILGNQIKVNGVISANGKNGGNISIIGTGDVTLAGTLMANGVGGHGGLIALTGNTVSLVAATINAWGATGGGEVDIGGGPHSTVALADAQSVSLDSATSINVNATDTGDGGHIVIWSNGLTTALGALTAQGGANGGNGGLIETSGDVLSVDGIAISTAAPNGAAGTWLLDPFNVTISSSASSGDSCSGGICTPTANNSILNVTTLMNALQASNVTVTTGSGGSQAGTITISSAIGGIWTQATTLTLNAASSITINAGITYCRCDDGNRRITPLGDKLCTKSDNIVFQPGFSPRVPIAISNHVSNSTASANEPRLV